jgi:hypothetical protein
MKLQSFVMPAWIAGIHLVREDAFGNVHVNLDSSSPCWNDLIEGFLIEAPPPGIFTRYFQRSN